MATVSETRRTLSAHDLLSAVSEDRDLPREPLLVPFSEWDVAISMLIEHDMETFPVHRYRLMVQHPGGFWVPVAPDIPPRAHLSTAAASALLAVDLEVARASRDSVALEDLNSRRLSDPGVLDAVQGMLDRHGIELPDSLEHWSNLLMYPALLVAEALAVLTHQHLVDGPPGTCPTSTSQEHEVLSVLLRDANCLPMVLPGLGPPDPFDSVSVWHMLAHVCDHKLLSVARTV